MMKEYAKAGQFIWKNSIAPHWDWIIPALLFVICVIWLLTVYRKGKFTFLPAFAIARVTVLDSIGRMEIVILLAIGLLFASIPVIIWNTPVGRQMLVTSPLITENIDELIGITESYEGDGGIVQPDPRGFDSGSIMTDPDGNSIQLSDGQAEPLDLSSVVPEPVIDQPADTSAGSVNDIVIPETPRTKADQFYIDLRERAIDNLIRQSAFMIADFFVAVIGFILAMLVLPGELNRGVTLSILPKPITRDEYVFGKAVGVWFIITVCFWLLAGELYLLNGFFKMLHGQPAHDLHLLEAMAILPFKYATIVLLTMGGTLRMPEIPATIISAAIFTGGHFVDRIYEIAINSNVPLIQYGLKAAYWMMPHLSQTTMIILDKDMTLITNWQELWGWVWQITIYNLILLWLLQFLFRKRAL